LELMKIQHQSLTPAVLTELTSKSSTGTQGVASIRGYHEASDQRH
jgi:hypothetical protein